jgi:hypothetical protein
MFETSLGYKKQIKDKGRAYTACMADIGIIRKPKT